MTKKPITTMVSIDEKATVELNSSNNFFTEDEKKDVDLEEQQQQQQQQKLQQQQQQQKLQQKKVRTHRFAMYRDENPISSSSWSLSNRTEIPVNSPNLLTSSVRNDIQVNNIPETFTIFSNNVNINPRSNSNTVCNDINHKNPDKFKHESAHVKIQHRIQPDYDSDNLYYYKFSDDSVTSYDDNNDGTYCKKEDAQYDVEIVLEDDRSETDGIDVVGVNYLDIANSGCKTTRNPATIFSLEFIRWQACKVVTAYWFRRLRLGLILLCCILLGIRTFEQSIISTAENKIESDDLNYNESVSLSSTSSSTGSSFLSIHLYLQLLNDTIFLVQCIFVVETGVVVAYYQERFLSNGWIVLDVVVLTIVWTWTLIKGNLFASSVLILRGFRLIRALRKSPQLRVAVESLLRTIPPLCAVAVLWMIQFYMFSVLCTDLFQNLDFTVYENDVVRRMEEPQQQRGQTRASAVQHNRFSRLDTSMMTLFQITTGGLPWAEVSNDITAVHGSAWIVFVSYCCVSTILFGSLVIAVVCNGVSTTSNKDWLDQPGVMDDLDDFDDYIINSNNSNKNECHNNNKHLNNYRENDDWVKNRSHAKEQCQPNSHRNSSSIPSSSHSNGHRNSFRSAVHSSISASLSQLPVIFPPTPQPIFKQRRLLPHKMVRRSYSITSTNAKYKTPLLSSSFSTSILPSSAPLSPQSNLCYNHGNNKLTSKIKDLQHQTKDVAHRLHKHHHHYDDSSITSHNESTFNLITDTTTIPKTEWMDQSKLSLDLTLLKQRQSSQQLDNHPQQRLQLSQDIKKCITEVSTPSTSSIDTIHFDLPADDLQKSSSSFIECSNNLSYSLANPGPHLSSSLPSSFLSQSNCKGTSSANHSTLLVEQRLEAKIDHLTAIVERMTRAQIGMHHTIHKLLNQQKFS